MLLGSESQSRFEAWTASANLESWRGAKPHSICGSPIVINPFGTSRRAPWSYRKPEGRPGETRETTETRAGFGGEVQFEHGERMTIKIKRILIMRDIISITYKKQAQAQAPIYCLGLPTNAVTSRLAGSCASGDGCAWPALILLSWSHRRGPSTLCLEWHDA